MGAVHIHRGSERQVTLRRTNNDKHLIIHHGVYQT